MHRLKDSGSFHIAALPGFGIPGFKLVDGEIEGEEGTAIS